MKKLSTLIIFFCSIFNMLQARTETSGRIVCLGDSLTAGYGLKKELAFPALLEAKLNEKKTRWQVINAGISGNTSAGGLRRIDWYFMKKVDILILALGANDGLRGLDTKNTYANLEKIIIKAKNKNPHVRILIAGMKVPPNMGQDYCQRFSGLFPRLAKQYECELIPFLLEGVAGEKKFNQNDGVHPNAAGQKIVMKNVLRVISKHGSTLQNKRSAGKKTTER
ncbi:MAG: arylesterase [Lentisphaeraceae bacterium]|nr:arylesterase [Lentisphaeraceae bacterium]